MDFTIGSAVRLGWETFKLRPWFFIGASAIIVLAYAALAVVGSSVGVLGTSEGPSLVATAVGIFVSAPINMGILAFSLAAHANPETVTLSVLWHPEPYWKFVGTSILFWIATGMGIPLLFLPGLVGLVFFMFATFIVIDQELGPFDAMKESMRITEGHRWQLLGLNAAFVLILFAGFLALGVGVFVAIPVIMVATAHVYRVLLHKAGPRPPEQTLIA
jgi:uncharacterized membrane protein